MATFQLRGFPRKLCYLVRYLGWYRALKACVAKPLELALRRFSGGQQSWRYVDSQFDRQHEVDTFRIVPVDALDVSQAQKEEAIWYEPTPLMEFGYVMSRLSISYADFTFVDIGSGKGRTLLLAAAFPFKRIVGIEFSPALHRIAESNIASYKGRRMCHDIKSVCEDAQECELPRDPMVLFLFNPFKENVLKRFLQNVHRSLLENPRPVILAYANPEHHHVMDSTPWLVRKGAELNQWCLIYGTNQSERLGP